MKLYATADTHKLPSLEWLDEECLAEWRVRSNLRSKYPSAGAIEFQNFTQIMLEDCLGWDIKKNKRKCEGMFGNMEAFGGTVEEQERHTLHIHFILWLLNVNCMRGTCFQKILKPEKKQENV